MQGIRWRAALAGTAVLLGLLPAVASAYAPALTCRDVVNIGPWQRIPIERFQPIQGVDSADAVTAYSVSATRPEQVVATNGKRIKVSNTNGCAWNDGLALTLEPTPNIPVSGVTSTIVSTAVLPSGRVLAAVREGTGGASRPHVLGSDNGRSGYRANDSGLPPQGAPKFLEAAADGRTVYLALTPTSEDGGPVPGAPLPGLPSVDNPTTGGDTGLLYASADSGRTWALRTSPDDLPAGGGGLDHLAIDPQNPDHVYALSNGLLLVSTNGGGNFTRGRINNEDATAVETGLGGEVVVFTANGNALESRDGSTFISRKVLSGVTSAASRRGDQRFAVEADGRLALVDVANGLTTDLPGITAKRGSLIGDVSGQGTYHGLSGHNLLRYADPAPPNSIEPPVAVGDLGLPSPPPGTITPAARTVQLKVGQSAVLDYVLALPKSPTPLDLMFLIDTSGSMSEYIENLKTNISKITRSVQSAGIDLRVGVSTLGTGSESDDIAPPYVNPNDPNDRGSQLYQLLRRIGPIDAEFGRALGSVKVKNQNGSGQAEAQLIALEQATAGLGVRDPRSPAAAPLYLVAPGQDAGWRPAPGIRRLIVHATDEAFAKPLGTRTKNGQPDFGHAITLMNEYRVQQIGITAGDVESQPDLARIARGTRTLAPRGGVDCGMDVILPAGAPLVCDTEGDFSVIIGNLVRSLADRQNVSLVAHGSAANVVRAIDTSRLHGIDVTVPNRLPFKVAVSCKGQSVGRYTEQLVAGLRESRVASSRLTIDCIGPAAAAVAAPPLIATGPPPAPPPAQAPAGVAPIPAPQPQLQPQSQVQVQAQVNPMTAAAMQQQEELQLALALEANEREQPRTGEELAMVSRHGREDSAALLLLAAAAAASASLGLARLRTRPERAVARIGR